MKQIFALLSGLVFGIGLIVSGMADPAKVLNFLDVFGTWDPRLAFVMGGAMIPMALAWLVQQRIERPIADQQFNLPERTGIDGKLALGAILFGIGWGTWGLCPGPALASLALAPAAVAPFVLAMLGGMALHRDTSRP